MFGVLIFENQIKILLFVLQTSQQSHVLFLFNKLKCGGKLLVFLRQN